MVRLQVISGRMAGTEEVARHFPFVMGRSAGCQLRLEDDGIWDEHCELVLDCEKGFIAKALSDARLIINGEPASDKPLRNGDVLDIGAAKVRFWLSDTRPKPFRWREWLTWAAFVAVLALELWLIYNLSA